MARGRKKRKQRKRISKPRAHLVQEKRDLRKEEEFLSQEVDLNNLGDYGTDALLKAIVYDLPSASEAEAIEYALALQKKLRGEASLLENPEMSDTIQAIREEAREIDKAAEAFERSKESFVDSVLAGAPQMSDKQRERLRAKGMQDFKRAIQSVRAGKATKRLKLMEMLRTAPEEEIAVAGRPRHTSQGLVIEPDVVSIMGVSLQLTPGVHKVPKPIADAYRNMLETRQQKAKKEALLEGKGSQMGTYEQSTLAQKLAEVNQEFGSN
jgi:hypothetical protein